MSARVAVGRLGVAGREVVLTPDATARADLARRLSIPGIGALTCRFDLRPGKAGVVSATGLLEAVVVREDVVTLDEFEVTVREPFSLRFVPEEALSEVVDPDDPTDEVGYAGEVLDLDEAMSQQLALALDPYPRRPAAE